MIFEHFALNVKDPALIAEWYVNNMEMQIVFKLKESPFTHFVADKSGRVVMELYNNTSAKIPEYKNQHPLIFHVAFTIDDPEETRENLMRAGASVVEEIHLDDGSVLIMLRDPFGIPLQLCKRANPLVP